MTKRDLISATKEDQDDKTRRVLKQSILPILVLAIGLLLTYQGTKFAAARVQIENKERFEKLRYHIEAEIRRRVNLFGYGLRGTRSAIVAAPQLTNTTFQDIFRSRPFLKEFPGALGIGYISLVERESIMEFQRRQREDGRPGFTVKTGNTAQNLYVVTYLEPAEQNASTIGFDIGQESISRETANFAADTGEPALTAPVPLIQLRTKSPGFLMLLPVYDGVELANDAVSRKMRLKGWVYMPILAAILFEGLREEAGKDLDFEVFEGESTKRENLIFDNDEHLSGTSSDTISQADFKGRTFFEKVTIPIGGRIWTVTFSEGSEFKSLPDYYVYWWAILGGIISALLACAEYQRERTLQVIQHNLAENNMNLSVYAGLIDQHALLSRTDTSGVITHANDNFCKVSGYSAKELIGFSHNIVNSGVHPPEFWKEMWHTISSGKIWTGEVCNRRKDGTLYYVASTIAPTVDISGTITGYMAIRTDISRLKESEASNVRALAQAKEATKAKSEFLANMSHEIRTPMNGVIGMTELLLDTSLNEEQRDYALTLKTSGQTLLSIINDILDFSKIEAGKITIECVPASIKGILSGLEVRFSKLIKEKSFNFTVVVSEGIPEWIMVDPVRLDQVLTNLVGNALKFTEPGGGIILQINLESLYEEAGTLCCSVSDTGIGIPQGKQDSIFDAFAQADSSTTRLYGGTGLGLTISRDLVRAMGGELKLRSGEGRGSNFFFELPFRIAAAQDKVKGKSGVVTSIGEGKKVLLAEDNPVNQKLAKALLEKVRFTVSTVTNGQEAVDAIEQGSFDLVLMDMQMPVMGGEEATRLIRAKENGSSNRVPIVALTAHALSGHRVRCLEAGMDDHVSKPINREELMAAIAKCLYP
jgi:PAS domain S-box-containing protein